MNQIILADQERDRLFDLLVATVDDPALFVNAVLQPKTVDGEPAELRKWQRGICSQIRARLEKGDRHIKVLARTCHGAGKTFIAAALLLWWICTRPYSRGLTTAPTWRQVEGPLWTEIAKLYHGSLLHALGFARVLNTQFDVTDTWYAIGASSDKPENLEGQQSNVASVRVVDEAKAVPKDVFDATKGMLGAPETLDVWISTPSISAGEFFLRDTGNDVDVIRAVVTIDDLIAEGVGGKENWKKDALRDWGLDSPEYQSRALAQYIDNAEGALFPVSWIERAMAQTWEARGPVVAGMDVAGSVDGDANAVALIQGPDPSTEKFQLLSITDWRERDTMVSKGKALLIMRPHGKVRIHVDVQGGIGQGIADQLRAEKYPAGDYRAAWKPRDPERFVNRKAEDHWRLREAFEREQIRIMGGAQGQKLLAEARTVQYQVTQAGKIKIIDPEDSPDLVDALSIAYANAGSGGTRYRESGERFAEDQRAWQQAF